MVQVECILPCVQLDLALYNFQAVPVPFKNCTDAAAVLRSYASGSPDAGAVGQSMDMDVPSQAAATGIIAKWINKGKEAALYGTSVDIHEAVEEDEFLAALHARAEKFDVRAEHAFG